MLINVDRKKAETENFLSKLDNLPDESKKQQITEALYDVIGDLYSKYPGEKMDPDVLQSAGLSELPIMIAPLVLHDAVRHSFVKWAKILPLTEIKKVHSDYHQTKKYFESTKWSFMERDTKKPVENVLADLFTLNVVHGANKVKEKDETVAYLTTGTEERIGGIKDDKELNGFLNDTQRFLSFLYMYRSKNSPPRRQLVGDHKEIDEALNVYLGHIKTVLDTQNLHTEQALLIKNLIGEVQPIRRQEKTSQRSKVPQQHITGVRTTREKSSSFAAHHTLGSSYSPYNGNSYPADQEAPKRRNIGVLNKLKSFMGSRPDREAPAHDSNWLKKIKAIGNKANSRSIR